MKKQITPQLFYNYAAAVLVVALCTLLGKIFINFFEPIDFVMIYLIGSVPVAVRFGKGPSIVFSFLSVCAFNFFFIEPLYAFNVDDKSYWLTFFVMLITSLVIASQAAIALEAKQQKLKSVLLKSISHDLRTPLASISGASESIIRNLQNMEKESVMDLAKSINSESERLTKIVTNLLDITSLESGNLKLKKQPYYIQEIIGSAILRLKKVLQNHQVEVLCAKDLPMVLIDGVLIEQVICNLLENAAKYTAQNSVVRISVSESHNNLLVEIADNGAGIFPQNKTPQKLKEGYGLGLPICESILKAHGSELEIKESDLGGAAFCFVLREIIFLKT